MTRFASIITFAVALAFVGTGAAKAAVVSIDTPAGPLAAQPSTVAATSETYLAGQGAFLTLGTPRGNAPPAFGWTPGNYSGLVLSGGIDPSIEQPSCKYDVSSDPMPDGFTIDLIDPAQWNPQTGLSYGTTCVPLGTTSLDGVIVWSIATCVATSVPNCSFTMPTRLEIGLRQDCCSYVNLGTFTVAAYSPIASITGDPWYHWRSLFRSDTVMIVKRFDGTVVKRIPLGGLAAGKHTAHFACHNGKTRYVHVHGIARDGATQNSPARKVVCR